MGVTNMTGPLRACSSTNINVFWSLQKDLFKGKGSLAKSYFKQNYCHVSPLEVCRLLSLSILLRVLTIETTSAAKRSFKTSMQIFLS